MLLAISLHESVSTHATKFFGASGRILVDYIAEHRTLALSTRTMKDVVNQEGRR